MSVKQKPHYTVPSTILADWIESQPERWWFVDGDPRLTSTVDFPCPSDELAPAVRRIGRDLLLLDKSPVSTAHGEVIGAGRLNELADTSNWRHRKSFLLCWADSDVDWLLVEDEALVEK